VSTPVLAFIAAFNVRGLLRWLAPPLTQYAFSPFLILGLGLLSGAMACGFLLAMFLTKQPKRFVARGIALGALVFFAYVVVIACLAF
jgi:hypothetical protein